MALADLANPSRFLSLADRVIPWLGGSTIYSTILVPLLIMTVAFTLLFFTLHLAAMRNEILRRRVRTLRLMQASAAS